MTNSKFKNNRTFRPIKINESLNELNKKILHKFGKLDYTIHSKWSEIVGSFFCNHSEPLNIKSLPVYTNDEGEMMYDKYLHVNVTPSAALEFQHFQNKIIEKINSYFGYKAIKGIKIHQKIINQKNLNSKIKNKNNIKNINKIKNTTLKINDKELKESILNLGISIVNEEK